MTTPDTDPFFHFFWPNITDRALAVAQANIRTINAKLDTRGSWARRNCNMACTLWARAFRLASVPVKRTGGHYYRGLGRSLAEWPAGSTHEWLVVDGLLFDPTASQFFDGRYPIATRWYHTGPPAGVAEVSKQGRDPWT